MEGPRSWPSSGGAGRPLTEDEMAEVKKDVSGGGAGGPVPGAGAERQVGPVRGRGAEALREQAGDAARRRREERERRVRGGGGDFSPAVGCGAITAGEHLSRAPESCCAVCPRPAWAEGTAPGPGPPGARARGAAQRGDGQRGAQSSAGNACAAPGASYILSWKAWISSLSILR